MTVLRLVAGIVLLLLTGWALMAIFSSADPEIHVRQFRSSTQCRDCHAEVFDEWKQSWHAQSWEDPEVRALSDNFANTDCIDCHAPRPIFSTGIGNRVLPRASRRSEGVDCIACHALPEGGVAGTIQNLNAPCTPILKVELQRAEYCGVCHDQHQTVQQWKASRYFEEGVTCIDCHMPFRDGDPGRGRDHTCLGGHDMDLVRRAVRLTGRRAEQGWVVEIENVGAGHSFPTDERSRAADLFWRPTVAPGREPLAWQHAYRIRSPYRHEVDLVDNLLLAHEKRAIALETGDGPIEVALFYKRTPFYEDPARPDPEREAHLIQKLVLVP